MRRGPNALAVAVGVVLPVVQYLIHCSHLLEHAEPSGLMEIPRGEDALKYEYKTSQYSG